MAKISENQLHINTQFNEDLATIKTQQLFAVQALGAVTELLERLLERLAARRLVEEDEKLVADFRRSIAEVRRLGLRLEPPADPSKPVERLVCPNCQAVLKARAGQQVERCDWCGHSLAKSRDRGA